MRVGKNGCMRTGKNGCGYGVNGGVDPKVSSGWRPHEVQKKRMKSTENIITKEERGLACPGVRRDAEVEREDRGCPGGGGLLVASRRPVPPNLPSYCWSLADWWGQCFGKSVLGKIIGP